jgi:heme exporter protein C
MNKLAQRALGPAALVTLALTVWLGIWVTPPDRVQGNLVRLLYIHPAIAWVALYVSFATAVIASALYLWPRTRSMTMDRVAEAALEVGVVFIGLTLVTGSIWGRPTWGVWWAWDARLTSTAIMGVLELGCLALRRANDDPVTRARRCAVLVTVSAINVPIIHFSVQWWNTLHQGASVLTRTGVLQVHGSMLATMLLSFVAFTLAFGWLLRARYRLGDSRASAERAALAQAIAQRQAEGAAR